MCFGHGLRCSLPPPIYYRQTVVIITSGCSSVARVLGLEPRGRWFKSIHPDQDLERNNMKLKIPKSIMPVVRILREEVPKPSKTTLETSYRSSNNTARWFRTKGKGNRKYKEQYCPMGLHKDSTNSLPLSSSEFDNGRCSSAIVRAFGKWWDSLSLDQAKEAVDLIWTE